MTTLPCPPSQAASVNPFLAKGKIPLILPSCVHFPWLQKGSWLNISSNLVTLADLLKM